LQSVQLTDPTAEPAVSAVTVNEVAGGPPAGVHVTLMSVLEDDGTACAPVGARGTPAVPARAWGNVAAAATHAAATTTAAALLVAQLPSLTTSPHLPATGTPMV
jgi:hypothetical protein